MDFLVGLLNAMPGAVAQGIIWGFMAIGVYITFRILDVADLTVDGSFTTGGATCVILTLNGVNMGLALLISFIAGLLAGLATGLFHTKFGIPAILAGILTQLSLYSINLRILGKANQPVSSYKYHLICTMSDLNKALLVATAFVLVIIAILYWFFGTEVGHAIRATGTNMNMARANGININSSKILALVISNGLVALAGGLLAQYQGYSDINMGRGAIVIGLAAVIIGEVLLGKIFKNFALKLLAVAIGGIIYYVVMQFVISLGLNTDDLKLLTAAVVAVFLGIPYIKSRYAETHVKVKEVK